VSQAVWELGQPEYANGHPPLDSFAGFVGTRGRTGRNQAQVAYIQSMLGFKVVVVCQKNLWEGHYRLMEALATGALVLTDPMEPLPYNFVNGTNILVYHSIAELKRFALYYAEHETERLRIARSGYETAMQFHRSWNIMERLVLGDWSNKIV
jgi:hypothetical protein